MSDKAFLDFTDLELAGSSVNHGDASGEHAVANWQQAIEQYEKALLQRLYPLYPSSRKLAAHLDISHTMIANKLRKYGIRKIA
jgi:TyrR family helix-turn-helix protein